MALRTRFFDLRTSRLANQLGLCKDDVPRLAEAVNTAQRQLLYAPEAGDESWYGTWAEVAFNVNRSNPYVTMPREIARLELINVCQRPVPIRNQFFEYLQFGNGRLPKTVLCQQGMDACRTVQVLSRNNAVTFTNLTGTPRFIAVYVTEQQDIGKRILLQGTDNNGLPIYSQDVFQRVNGVFVSFANPFAVAPMQFSSITGIQKDITAGSVQVFEVDPATGIQTALLTMEPTEETAWYRRYYLDALPCGCCPSTTPSSCADVQVTALAKLDLIPVAADTDYLLIQNIEAIIHECMAVRYSQIDTSAAKRMEQYHHKKAISLLNGEIGHFVGKNDVAIHFAPFGSARLEKQGIGLMI